MQFRGLVVAIALVLAASATTAVYLYVQGVQERAETGGGEVSVIVSKEDIPVGTKMDDLISKGAFTTMALSEDSLVTGAITDLSELEGKQAQAAIVAGEQIPIGRLEGTLAGGALGIPAGHEGVSVSLETPRTTGGAIRAGDNVTIYSTFTGIAGGQGNANAATVTLVPDAQVLAVTGTGNGEAGTADATSDIQITLALRPRDTQKLIFAQEQGSIWLALLPPNENSQPQSPMTMVRVLR